MAVAVSPAPTQDGSSPRLFDVPAIKDKAGSTVDALMHANPAPRLAIRAASSQAKLARESEALNNLPLALEAYTKAARLAQFAMSSNDVRSEAIKKEVTEFMAGEGRDLVERTKALEAKMIQLDENAQRNAASTPSKASTDADSVQKTAGGSISDRMRALQSAGMAVGTTSKRISRDLGSPLPSGSDSPVSSPSLPSSSSSATNNSAATPVTSPRQPHFFAPPPPVSHAASLANGSAVHAHAHTHHAHALVPLSALAPPSPAQTPVPSASEFTAAFPSIDEFEEDQLLQHQRVQEPSPSPSISSTSSTAVITSTVTTLPASPRPYSQSRPDPLAKLREQLARQEKDKEQRGQASAPESDPYDRATKAFPVLPPLDPAPRPASTPAPPTADLFTSSRPASPKRDREQHILTPLSTMMTDVNGVARPPPPPSSSPLVPETRSSRVPSPLALSVSGSSGTNFAATDAHVDVHSSRSPIPSPRPLVDLAGPSAMLPPPPVDRSTRPGIPSSSSVTAKQDLHSSKPSLDLSLKQASSSRKAGLLPKGSVTPAQLRALLSQGGSGGVTASVLLLDVRERAAFECVRIGVAPAVCVEPSVVVRPDTTADALEDALAASPNTEHTLFKNRDKFDLVVLYDEASQHAARGTPMELLAAAIWEREVRRPTRGPPAVLVGGLEAWKRDGGEVIGDGADAGGVVNGVSKSEKEGRDEGVVTRMYVKPMTLAENQAKMRHSVDQAVARQSPKPSPVPLPSTPVSTSTPPATSGPTYAPPSYPPPSSSPYSPPTSTHTPSSSISAYTPLPSSYAPSPSSESVPVHRLVRKQTFSRQPNISPPMFARNIADSASSPPMSPSLSSHPITYPLLARQPTGPPAFSSPISPLPQASINPSPLARRRSDYVDQSSAVVSAALSHSHHSRTPTQIDYPALDLRPPPVAATRRGTLSSSSVVSNGVALTNGGGALANGGSANSKSSIPFPSPPTISSEYPVMYWPDIHIGISGLKNMGNTCYMNATIQCLSATSPFAQFFRDGSWNKAVNMLNPLGTKGDIAAAFSSLVRDMWNGQMPYITPFAFRKRICGHAAQFGGTEQHDSQEFLSFLMDGLHEDLNRVLQKTVYEPSAEEEAMLERLPTQVASRREWEIYRQRNDSIVVDYFQGQFRSRLQCLTCGQTSTTYNAFMYLSLPIPPKGSKISLDQCLDAFVAEEVLEKSDAWFCPRCKCKRKATKQLSLSRLPPVLLIHLKRFSIKVHFTDKLDKLVTFPLQGLDLTNYMPSPLPPGADAHAHSVPANAPEDPRSQMPPYRYDLYGVTNHFGSLSSGHYTAFVASRGQWLYCDDSRITPADAKDVVGKPAYVLYYKRVKT